MEKIKSDLKKLQITTYFIYLFMQLITLVPPYFMGVVIDDYIPNKKISSIIIGIILFVSIPLFTVILQTGYNYFTVKFVRKKGNEIAIQIMEKIVYKEISFFDSNNSMELLSYSGRETVGYINFVLIELSRLYVCCSISAIIIVGITLLINPMIGLVQLLYIPFIVFPVKFIMRSVSKEVQEVVDRNAVINQKKGDTFQAIEFVKLNRLESRRIQDVAKENDAINKLWGKIAALDNLSDLWSNGFATELFTGITFAVGTLLILLAMGLHVGQLISILSYCALYYSHMNLVVKTMAEKKKKESEYSSVFSYLKLQGEREANANKKKLSFQDKIQFSDCSFSYNGSEPVLDHLNLTIEKGKWTGIVGESGSGKSTVFDLIMKLYDAPAGQLFIDGVDIHMIDCFSVRDTFTKITQDVFLFPGTIADNLKMMKPDATPEELQEALRFACLENYVSELPNGIFTDVGEAGKLMSGGERQRLSIAMGILRGNQTIFLDEVTANLDEETEAQLAEHFFTLRKKGYTIVSISHRKEFLKYADKIYSVQSGKAILNPVL